MCIYDLCIYVKEEFWECSSEAEENASVADVVADGSEDEARDSRRGDIVREIFVYEIARPMHNKRRNNRSRVEEDDLDNDEIDGVEVVDDFYELNEEDC